MTGTISRRTNQKIQSGKALTSDPGSSPVTGPAWVVEIPAHQAERDQKKNRVLNYKFFKLVVSKILFLGFYRVEIQKT